MFENFGPEANALRRLLRTPLRKPLDPYREDLEPRELTEEDLAIHLRLALEELGPTFVKFGQLLSTRPDLLPPVFIKELEHLLNNVPAVSWEEIEPKLEHFYGEKKEEIFSNIDQTALASASLAQVHSATLTTGEEVAIKILRPHIHEVIQQDLEILETLARIFQNTTLGKIYNFVDLADEFAYILKNELDFYRERMNADRFRKSFAEMDFVHIPIIYEEFSGKEILVMERLEGIRIDDIEALVEAGYKREKLATYCAKVIVKEILEDGFFHADPHPGNLIILEGGRLGVMDFGMVGYLRDKDRLHLIQLYIAAIEQDIDALIDELVRMGAIDLYVNQRNLTRDIDRVLNNYYGLPLDAINANEVIEDILPVLYEHHIKIPSNLWFLIKSLTIMEGVGLTLDPGFDIFEFSKPYITKLTRQLLFPQKKLFQHLIKIRTDWGDLIDEFPRSTLHIMDQLENGELLRFSVNGMDDILKAVDRMVTRVALSLIIAALLLGISFLIPQFTTGSFGQIMLIVSFLGVAGLGLWLLINMIRRK
jgi:ubiquinone biosynthesis protein